MPGLLVDRVVSPPAIPPSGSDPGSAEWPGGIVVHVGGAAYESGVYDPGDPPAGVFQVASRDRYVAMATGQSPVRRFPPPHTPGVRGPILRMRLPARTTTGDVTVTFRGQWVDGYYEEYESSEGPSVSAPWLERAGDLSDAEGGVFADVGGYGVVKTALGDRAFAFECTWFDLAPSDNLVSLVAIDHSAEYQSVWHVWAVETAIGQAAGSWPLRQRQAMTPGSWPLRQRQAGGFSGSWPLRQRQAGV